MSFYILIGEGAERCIIEVERLPSLDEPIEITLDMIEWALTDLGYQMSGKKYIVTERRNDVKTGDLYGELPHFMVEPVTADNHEDDLLFFLFEIPMLENSMIIL